MWGVVAMTVSVIAVTEGSGKNIWTDSRTVSSVVREAQVVLLGESTYPTHYTQASGISVATTADHVLQLMADGTNYSRIKRFEVSLTDDIPATATVLDFEVRRLSTAGTGGGSPGFGGNDADAYAGAAMTLPTAKGTEAGIVRRFRLPVPSVHPFVSCYVWEARLDAKPIVFGTSTSAGICWKIITGVASCTVQIAVEFTTTSFT